jgi:signal transduction histidine kinase
MNTGLVIASRIVNKDKVILMANKAFAAAAGLDIKCVAGTNFDSIIDSLQARLEPLPNVVTASADYEGYKVTFTNAQNIPQEFVIYLAPITNVEEEVIGSIGIATDITALAEQQAQLQQREKLAALGQMAAGIVHEIKNPLTTLKGFSQLINTKSTDPVIKNYAQIMETEANDVNKVVSDFLMFAKPQPMLKNLTVNELIKSMQLMLESHAFVHNICTEFSFAPQELPILGDPSQIKQVILNIVENAIQSMMQTNEPCLNITTELAASSMLITITDNGTGIPATILDKVGTPFFTTKDKGTGLGLSICYQIIKEHNGHINISSEPGHGTTFIISLPCLPSTSLAAAM